MFLAPQFCFESYISTKFIIYQYFFHLPYYYPIFTRLFFVLSSFSMGESFYFFDNKIDTGLKKIKKNKKNGLQC